MNIHAIKINIDIHMTFFMIIHILSTDYKDFILMIRPYKDFILMIRPYKDFIYFFVIDL